jgi:hypothetical protein
MKALVLMILTLFHSISLWAVVGTVEGEWKLSGMIHHGRPIPLPNPELNLRWTFFSNGTFRLFWDRGSPDFCEGFGHFKLIDEHLNSKIFALNPKNAAECAKDTDLQIGRETKTKMEVTQGQIAMYFQLGDEELVYLLTKVR